jgi:hypothetical protein
MQPPDSRQRRGDSQGKAGNFGGFASFNFEGCRETASGVQPRDCQLRHPQRLGMPIKRLPCGAAASAEKRVEYISTRKFVPAYKAPFYVKQEYLGIVSLKILWLGYPKRFSNMGRLGCTFCYQWLSKRSKKNGSSERKNERGRGRGNFAWRGNARLKLCFIEGAKAQQRLRQRRTLGFRTVCDSLFPYFLAHISKKPSPLQAAGVCRLDVEWPAQLFSHIKKAAAKAFLQRACFREKPQWACAPFACGIKKHEMRTLCSRSEWAA